MRSAVYLATDDAAMPAVAVITSDAVRVPNAVQIQVPAADSPFAPLRSSSPATLGEGWVGVGDLLVVAGDAWAPPRPRLRTPGAALVRAKELHELTAAVALPAPEALRAPLRQLASGLRTRDTDAAERAALRLLGLGPGLTPSGDDVLCGVLATCHALLGADTALAPIAARLQAVTEHAFRRTSFVSAALLRHAARGEVIPELAALLEALEQEADLGRPLSTLLAVGHHSGSDLARGVATTLAAV